MRDTCLARPLCGVTLPFTLRLRLRVPQKDIVFSGLEDTMKTSTDQIVKLAHERNCSYRIAAFVIAIEKIAAVYKDAGFTI